MTDAADDVGQDGCFDLMRLAMVSRLLKRARHPAALASSLSADDEEQRSRFWVLPVSMRSIGTWTSHHKG